MKNPITPCFYCGGDEGDRTLDLSVANAALSQLSYIPTIIDKRSVKETVNPQ